MEEHKRPEISYRRELRQNYLMIGADEELAQRFEVRMLAGNMIEGLLKFRVRREDNRIWFCYEITSRQPLSRLVERQPVTAPQIRRLLLSIAQTLTRMEDYLLGENMMLLDPELIYIDPEDFRPGLCLLPGHEGDFPKEFSEFLQFLMRKTDHQDKEAVMLIYGLYQESLRDNYGLDNLLRWLMKEDYPNMEHMDEERAERPEARGEPWPGRTEPGRGPWPERIKAGREPSSERPKALGELRPGRTEAGKGSWPEKALPSVENARLNGETAKKKPGTRENTKKAAAFFLIPVLAVLGLWLWKGWAGVAGYGIWAAAGGTAAAAGLAFIYIWKRRSGEVTIVREKMPARASPGGNGTQDSWEMIFAEEEPAKERDAEFLQQPGDMFGGVFAETAGPERTGPQPRDATHTALLYSVEPQPEDPTHTAHIGSVRPQPDIRRLSGENGTEEEIPISYYPFLLGKQENLADYILRRDTISRLHARIDRRDGSYWLTDLNSTNGTCVNGRTLQANETVRLEVGDCVDLADLHFRFH